MHRPTSLSRICNPALDGLQFVPFSAEGAPSEFKEPTAHDGALHPKVGDLRKVYLVAGFCKDLEPFGICLHQAVFNPVVHHLDVVTSAGRAAVHVAVLRCQRQEDRLHLFHWCGVAAHHHAVAVLKSPDATRSSGINKVDAVPSKLLVPADRVVEVGVTTVNHRVAFPKEWDEFVDHGLGGIAARHHHPDLSWRWERGNEILHAVGGGGAVFCDLVGLLSRAVPDGYLMSASKEALDHVAAHLSKTNKSDLHRSLLTCGHTWAVTEMLARACDPLWIRH